MMGGEHPVHMAVTRPDFIGHMGLAHHTAAEENLEYTKQAHPQAQAKWFDAAKRQYGDTWIRKVKAQAGGGRHGR